MMPYGYLSMVYLVIFLPFIFHKIMVRKLIEWDQQYATIGERYLAKQQNKNSGIKLLMQNSHIK